MKATYNITNDKIKFWPEDRLPADQYERARRHGFVFWHGSKCFAAKWSPGAEDFVTELGGVIEADDAPDDVEARVSRFQNYASEAEKAAESAADYLNTRANTERRQQNAVNAIEKNASAAAALDTWTAERGGYTEPLEPGSFRTSERPTGVNCALVVAEK